jgi:hypothetical protein
MLIKFARTKQSTPLADLFNGDPRTYQRRRTSVAQRPVNGGCERDTNEDHIADSLVS